MKQKTKTYNKLMCMYGITVTLKNENKKKSCLNIITVGEQNYFTGYGILLHELPVVAVLFTQSNNNEGTMKNSILHEIFCKFLLRTSRQIVKLEF